MGMKSWAQKNKMKTQVMGDWDMGLIVDEQSVQQGDSEISEVCKFF